MTGPYAASATVYLTRGVGSPLPLPFRAKKTPPDNYTGYEGLRPSGADVHEWATNGKGIGNVCLRLVETVIGIDVDAYGTKPGAETLAEREATLGALPPTWVSTSRALPSGIRFYRVPAGRVWADVVGPGIEVIHYGHRYAVVAPSIHPDTGLRYAWVLNGQLVPGPKLEDLPDLPPAWVEFLDRGPIEDRSRKADVSADDVSGMLADFRDGEPCRWLASVLGDASHELRNAVSRHDTVRRFIATVVRAGEQGHVGAPTVLGMLWTEWIEAMASGEARKPDHGEWERMVSGAVAIVVESPTAEADRGCCGAGGVDLDLSFDPGVSDALEAFWESRDWLSHIRLYARARVVSPWSLLGVVLARMVVRIRHEVVLPPIIGSPASLNLFVALVGRSGEGKGASERAAAKCVSFGEHLTVSGIGSGEGIAHLYAHREKQEVIRDRWSVLFSVPEVDTLTALGHNRQGATLLPQLRSAWSGEGLGFSYADKTKALPIPEHEYRMGLVLGVQPLRARALLEDHTGGTPQRFVWLPTQDREAPDEPPEAPPTWEWPGIAEPLPIFNGLAEMVVPDIARETIQSAQRMRLRGDAEKALDGHSLLCRLKVAAAFALMGSSYTISESDWSLAGTVMLVSDRTRDKVEAELARDMSTRNKSRAKAEGERQVIVSDVVSEAQVLRVAGVVERKLDKVPDREWLASADLRRGLASSDRGAYEQAVDVLLEAGKIEQQESGNSRHYRLVE